MVADTTIIEIVDKRILTSVKAFEIKYIEPFQMLQNYWCDRSANVLVTGINPEEVASEWVLSDRFLTEDDENNAVIGDGYWILYTISKLRNQSTWKEIFYVGFVSILSIWVTQYISHIKQ